MEGSSVRSFDVSLLDEDISLGDSIISAMGILQDLDVPYVNPGSFLYPSTSTVEVPDLHLPLSGASSSVDQQLTGLAPSTDTQKTLNLPLLFRDKGASSTVKENNYVNRAEIASNLLDSIYSSRNVNDLQETIDVTNALSAEPFYLRDNGSYSCLRGVDFDIPITYKPVTTSDVTSQPSTSTGQSVSIKEINGYFGSQELDCFPWDLEDFISGFKHDYAPVAHDAQNFQVLPVTVSDLCEEIPVTQSDSANGILLDISQLPIITDADLVFLNASSCADSVAANGNELGVPNLPIVIQADLPIQSTSSGAEATTTATTADMLNVTHTDFPMQSTSSATELVHVVNPPAALPLAANGNGLDTPNLLIVHDVGVPAQSTNSVIETTTDATRPVQSRKMTNQTKRKRSPSSTAASSKRKVSVISNDQGTMERAGVSFGNNPIVPITPAIQGNSNQCAQQFRSIVPDAASSAAGANNTAQSSQGNSTQALRGPLQNNAIQPPVLCNPPPTPIATPPLQGTPTSTQGHGQFRGCPMRGNAPPFRCNPPSCQGPSQRFAYPRHTSHCQSFQRNPSYVPNNCQRFNTNYPPHQHDCPRQYRAPQQHQCPPPQAWNSNTDNCPPRGTKSPPKSRKRPLGTGGDKVNKKLRTSAYIEYGKEVRSSYERTLSMAEVAAMWKNLSKEEKEVYEKKADNTRREYEDTCKQYKS